MRLFNDFEKRLILRAINLEKPGRLITLANIVENDLDGYFISIKAPDDVTIQASVDCIANGDLEGIKKLDHDVTTKLLTIVTLFEYLVNERLIFLFGDIDINRLGKPVLNPTTCNFAQPDIQGMIFRYSRKQIFISETLKDIARNDFSTPEERKTHRELRLTQGGVCLTFLALLFSIYATNYHTGTVTVENTEKAVPVSLKEEQVRFLQRTADCVTAIELLQMERVRQESQRPATPMQKPARK